MLMLSIRSLAVGEHVNTSFTGNSGSSCRGCLWNKLIIKTGARLYQSARTRRALRLMADMDMGPGRIGSRDWQTGGVDAAAQADQNLAQHLTILKREARL